MSAQKYVVVLEPSAVKELKKIVSSGTHKTRTITRARILLMTNTTEGAQKKQQEVSASLGVWRHTVRATQKKYVEGGLETALYELPRPGKPKKFTIWDEADVVAIACTDAPAGYDRWTLSLLEEKMTARWGKSIDRNTIDKILLKNECKPWLKKNVVYSED